MVRWGVVRQGEVRKFALIEVFVRSGAVRLGQVG